MGKQKIRSVLIPELGVVLEPRGVVESTVETDFTRAFTHLVGQSSAGSILLRATSGGDLRVAVMGAAFEIYAVYAGNAPNAYDAPNTFASVVPQYVTDLLIETFGATIQFCNLAGVWGNPKTLPVGFYSFDFIHYGIRIQNRVPASVAVYEITLYR
jgi:hypothetical protein